MASTIASSTLTVTITEAMTIVDSKGGGRTIATTNTFDLATIVKTASRLVTITTTVTGLVSFADTTLTPVQATAFSSGYVAGHYDEDTVVYLRITNKDDTNFVILVFRNADDDEFAVILDAGQTFIYPCDNGNGLTSTMDAAATAVTPTLANLSDVTADADTASVDLEVFIAMI